MVLFAPFSPFHGTFFLSVSLLVLTPICSSLNKCSILDRVTTNRIYRNLTTDDLNQCITECVQDDNCASYNYEYFDPEPPAAHICQLSRCGDNGTLVDKRGFQFHHLRLSKIEEECKIPEKPVKWFRRLEESIILRRDPRYFHDLVELLGSRNHTWMRCYRSGGRGFNMTTFNRTCTLKGPTVTIIRVENFTFGGYINTSWPEKCEWIQSKQAFLFSLYSHHDNQMGNYQPLRFNITDYRYAANHCPRDGYLMFGGGDLVVPRGRKGSYSHPTSYSPPPGCQLNSDYCPFYTGQTHFTPSDVEVFYQEK